MKASTINVSETTIKMIEIALQAVQADVSHILDCTLGSMAYADGNVSLEDEREVNVQSIAEVEATAEGTAEKLEAVLQQFHEVLLLRQDVK